jgi:uncharacterized protein YjbI with pentapeptide repeats
VRANFAMASLKGTDFSNAYLYRTSFEGVDLSQAKGLTQAQIAFACGNAETKLPEGLVVPKSWPCD